MGNNLNKIRIGQIGYGYWGINIARNISQNPFCVLTAICDTNTNNLFLAKQTYKNTKIYDSAEKLFLSNEIDAIIISTPASTHFQLGKLALDNGKHLLITKPLTTSLETSLYLTRLAEQNNKILLVDHTFLYSPAISKLKTFIESGEIGKPLYYDSMRTGLGIFKTDVNVIFDLAIHDIAIVDFLFDEIPIKVNAFAFDCIKNEQSCLAYINFFYASGLHVHIAANWLSPIKQRMVVVVGENKMATWDDSIADNKLSFYDTGVKFSKTTSINGRASLDYKQSEPYHIKLSSIEALNLEIVDFIDCIYGLKKPTSNGQAACRVIGMADAAILSAQNGGNTTNILL